MYNSVMYLDEGPEGAYIASRRNVMENVKFLKDVQNSVVIDDKTKDAYLVRTSLLQKACIYRGHHQESQGKFTSLIFKLVGYLCPSLLGIAWVVIVEKSYINGYKHEEPILPRIFVTVYLLLAFLVVADNVITWAAITCFKGISPLHKVSTIMRFLPVISLSVFMLLFPIYMSYIAWVYPRSCHFIQYKRDTSLRGDDKDDAMQYFIQCELRICLWNFCMNGGQVLFSMIAHMFPVVFALTCHLAIASTVPALQLTAQIIDLVDIQDFSLLLIEEHTVRNFWGRDASETIGFSIKKRWLWMLALASLWAACACVTFLTATKVSRAILRANNRRDMRDIWEKNMKPGFVEQLFSEYSTGQVWVVVNSVLSLIFVELPFLFVRFAFTDCYGMVASTMILKNISNASLDALKIFYCGNIAEILRIFPSLGMFMDISEEITGDIRTQPTGDCENPMVSPRINQPVASPRLMPSPQWLTNGILQYH